MTDTMGTARDRWIAVLRRIAVPIMLAIIALILDLVTKMWAELTLELHEPVSVLGEVARLTLGYNTGSAFGLFQNGGALLLMVTGVMIVGLAALLVAGPRAGIAPPLAQALGLMLGGAVANFADRWPDGRVTDFLDVGVGALRWPTFNLADSSIVVGVAIILLATLIRPTVNDASPVRAPSPDVGRA